MPKRPRSHVLETRSQRALEKGLPEHWIVRWESIDYGIDGTVEVVEEDGTVTGEVFAVQLKGTNQEDVRRARLASDRLSYYSAYSLPVLLVFYNADSGRICVRWVDEILDTASPETLRRWRSQETVSIGFGDEHDLASIGATALANATREALSTRPRRPLIAVFLKEFQADPDQPPIRSPDGILNQVHDETSDAVARLLPGRVHFIDDEGAANVVVGLTAATDAVELVVRVRSTGTMSPEAVTWSGPIREIPYWVSEPEEPSVAVAHVLLAIGFALGHKDDVASAVQLLILAAPTCAEFLETEWPAALALVTLLANGQREADAIALAEDLVAQGRVELASRLLMVPVFARSQSASVSKAAARVQRACIAQTEDERDRGIRSYNLANALRAQGDYTSAIKAYLAARRHEPAYIGRHYWWKELASCFFLVGRFRWAAECYRRALSCDLPDTPAVADADDPEEVGRSYWLTPIRGLYADALIHAGAYSEGVAEFAKYRTEAEEPAGEWLLTEMLFSSLWADGLVTDGSRRNSEAMQAAEEIRQLIEAGELAEARELIRESIRLDPLEPELWYLSERVENEVGQPSTLLFSQSMLALMSGSVGPWAAAAVNSFNPEAGGPLIVVALALSGYEKFGTRFVEQIAHVLRTEAGLSSKEVGLIRTAIRTIVDRTFTFAEAREAGLPIPDNMGDGPIPLFGNNNEPY